MREQIKEQALDLMMRHGYLGVSLGDVAQTLKISRTNVHYHFGTKDLLVEEVLSDYVDRTTLRLESIWNDPTQDFDSKIAAVIKHSREKYRRYNPRGQSGHPWSLISRIRQEGDALSPGARASIRRFIDSLLSSIIGGLRLAQERGEFSPALPVDDAALQYLMISNAASPLTQDMRSFEPLERGYLSFTSALRAAYGGSTND